MHIEEGKVIAILASKPVEQYLSLQDRQPIFDCWWQDHQIKSAMTDNIENVEWMMIC